MARRKDFFQNAGLVVAYCIDKKHKLLASALTFATASYIMSAHHKMTDENIKATFKAFIDKKIITPIDSKTINESLCSDFQDFEDAIQYHSALRENADIIITRNKKDFSASKIPVFTPQEFLDAVAEE
ncbi:MAG: hypothetical protein J6U21_13365 [Bacteroidales bacterium]|nr:hypothetical protein [Bacteroidales bacterium]